MKIRYFDLCDYRELSKFIKRNNIKFIFEKGNGYSVIYTEKLLFKIIDIIKGIRKV